MRFAHNEILSWNCTANSFRLNVGSAMKPTAHSFDTPEVRIILSSYYVIIFIVISQGAAIDDMLNYWRSPERKVKPPTKSKASSSTTSTPNKDREKEREAHNGKGGSDSASVPGNRHSRKLDLVKPKHHTYLLEYCLVES